VLKPAANRSFKRIAVAFSLFTAWESEVGNEVFSAHPAVFGQQRKTLTLALLKTLCICSSRG